MKASDEGDTITTTVVDREYLGNREPLPLRHSLAECDEPSLAPDLQIVSVTVHEDMQLAVSRSDRLA